MKKRYTKLTEEINKIEQEIESVSIRRNEAGQRVDETKAVIKTLQTDLKAALVVDDQKKAGTLEKKISELSDKIICRDRLLIEGLAEKLPGLDRQLTDAKENKNKTFSKLSQKWLESEVLAYDSAAKNLIEKIKRLMVVNSMLRDIGATEVYCQAVGFGYEVLPAARIPRLKNFDRQEFLSGSYRSGPELRDKVMKEITG